jgi:Sialic acid synthase
MTKVIAEIGINFGGNLSVAKDLIKQAHNAGCWGVKFQFRNPESFYFIDNEIGDAMVRSEILKNHLSFNEIRDLHEFSNKLNKKFGMSFFREEDVKYKGHILKDAD